MNLQTITEPDSEYDYVVIGSGFGGSVAALRLAEKGYKVLVIEKGRKYSSGDFPETNWKIRKWLWIPSVGFFGFFKMTFFRHVGVLSGVGVGGGSLVYANTLPRPSDQFFNSGTWSGLADWKNELENFYTTAEKMLGTNRNPKLFDSDIALREVAALTGMEKLFEPTPVSIFFGEPEKRVADPFFNGEGPEREGCSFCGSCMTGCRHNAKNSLDRNYLWLAVKRGASVLPDHFVEEIRPAGSADGEGGYEIIIRKTGSVMFRKKKRIRAGAVVIAGGVLGTVRLLLNMKRKSMPMLSDQVGNHIRTNNESLVLVDSRDYSKDFSKGIAIGSIFPPDENSHVEAVRYGSGSGFWKLLGVPLTHGNNILKRLGMLFLHLIKDPSGWIHLYFTKDHARQSVILLFMQHLNSTLRLKRGLFKLRSAISEGTPPTAFMSESRKIAETMSEVIKGKPFVLITEAITGIPTTAHILGGAVIGKDRNEGVIDSDHRVFGYKNLFVCDGSSISANPGVNPSLTITAMAERAMSKIAPK